MATPLVSRPRQATSPSATGRAALSSALGLAIACLTVATACEPETPPKPKEVPAAAAEAAEAPTLQPGETQAIFTFAADRGTFADGQEVAAIPEDARGMVRVSLLDGPRPPAGKVWVANLKAETAEVPLETVDRDLFEELALGQGLSSAVVLPEGLEPPEQLAAAGGEIIVYKTSWCGVCKKVEAYLDRKGIAYVAKDIESDRAAAGELKAKADKAGVKTGSVPVIDVRGELMVGFDRARLEKMLAS